MIYSRSFLALTLLTLDSVYTMDQARREEILFAALPLVPAEARFAQLKIFFAQCTHGLGKNDLLLKFTESEGVMRYGAALTALGITDVDDYSTDPELDLDVLSAFGELDKSVRLPTINVKDTMKRARDILATAR